MTARLIIFAAVLLVAATTSFAQSTTASAQQALKDQGFYYGEVTGTKDADTTAAIRRYQIRNGLQVTGDLNAETLKSLGLKGAASSTPAPSRSTPPPATAKPEAADEDTSDLRDDSSDSQQAPLSQDQTVRPPPTGPGYAPAPGYGVEPRADVPIVADEFAGTPYETAPPEVQRQIVAGAQAFLARRGYYRSGVDGLYGPGTEFALRAYQTRFGLDASGRLDMETLAAFGLLPEQQGRGLRGPRRRILRGPPVLVPPGERIYIPR